MATDEAILQAVQARLVPPTLRFYGWQPACLSLGQAQAIADVNLAACAALGVDVVRRSTGGRAILHTDELTYSLAAPENDLRVAGDIVTSYRKLSEGLVEGLRRLGIFSVQSEPHPQPENTSRSEISPVCFQAPSHYEITVGGKKLVGSAQMRKGGVLLQHGAIPLGGDIARICQLLTIQPDPDSVRQRATTIEQALSSQVSFDQAAAAFAQGFAHALKIELVQGTLTSQEQSLAQELRREKYGRDEWNKRL